MKISEREIGIGLIGLFVLIVIILFTIFIIPSPLKEWAIEHGFNRVEPIEYRESEWYLIQPSMLWNLDRPDYVFPNDELHYVVLFENRKNYPIEIESNFQLFVADNNVTAKEKLDYVLKLSPEHPTDGISYAFFANEEGINRLEVNLTIINSSNQIILDEIKEITKFNVQSPTFMLQDRLNQTTNSAFFVSIVVGLGTLTALGLAVIFSRKQVKELRSQLNEQRKEMKLAYLPHIIPRQDQDKGQFEIKSIQNIGNGPAKNIEVTIKKVSEEKGITVKILGLTSNQSFLIPDNERISGKIDEEIEVTVQYDDVTDTTHAPTPYRIKISEMTREYPPSGDNT